MLSGAQKPAKVVNPKRIVVSKSKQSNIKSQISLSDGEIYNQTIGGIVIVLTKCAPRGISQGSGFIVGKEYIVTNRHVVECGNVTQVKLLVSQEIFDVDGVYFHPDKDIAILKVPKLDGQDISLKLAPKDSLKMNDLVYVLGNPSNIEGFFSKGNIRLIRTNQFFFDAPLAPGSSGSPVLDNQGRVVGIETTGTKLAGGAIFGGALPAFEVTSLLPSVQKGIVANLVDKRTKVPETKKDESPVPSQRNSVSTNIGASIGAILGINAPIASDGTTGQSRVIREPTAEELVLDAENKTKYSLQMAIDSAQKALDRLPKNSAQRETLAASAHGIIAECYVKLNKMELAVQHILQAWKDGDDVRVKVRQVRENKQPAANNADLRQGFVDGIITTGNKIFTYQQDRNSVSSSYPDQSFTVKSEQITKVEYNPAQKKLSMLVKISSESGKENKKDFQFYPVNAVWRSNGESYAMQRQVDCASCSDILFALVKASNEFVRQEK